MQFRCDFWALSTPSELPFSDDINARLYKSEMHQTTRYYTDGLLHRDDGGPTVVERKHGHWTFTYHQRGVVHRDGGPAVIYFNSNDSDCWVAPEFKELGLGDPDFKWSSVKMEFHEHGQLVRKCTYLGVCQFYPTDYPNTMLTSARRVTFNAADRKEYRWKKAKALLRKAEVTYLREVWDTETGALVDRQHGPIELKWFQKISDWRWQDDITPIIEAWAAKNMEGRFDPFTDELFTDPIDEWAFLEEFSK